MGSLLAIALLVRLSLKHSEVTRVSAGDVANIRVVDGGLEANRLPGDGHLGVQLIDLLKGETLRLVDASVDENHTDEAETTPDEEHLGLHVGIAGAAIHHVRGGVGNGPVEQPVGGGRDGETLGAGLEREQFAGHDPGNGAPGAGEEEDVDAHKCDQDFVGDG